MALFKTLLLALALLGAATATPQNGPAASKGHQQHGGSSGGGRDSAPGKQQTNGKAAPPCRATGHTVTATGTAPAAPLLGDAFNQTDAQEHFANTYLGEFLSDTATTFSCVDSRSKEDVLATPGGDIAELIGGVAVFVNQTGTPFSSDVARDIIAAAMASNTGIASPDRPLYYHTAEDKLASVFKAVYAAGVKPKHIILPELAPTSETERNIWLEALTTGDYQGCGHLRLMISNFSSYGLPSPDIPRAVIRAFYEYWWSTPLDSPERKNVFYEVLQGPLNGKAVSIVQTHENDCPGASPAVPPAHLGSQVFVYHGKAVEAFRNKVLVPFFLRYAASRGKTLDEARFKAGVQSIQALHLGATLAKLAPANALNTFVIDVTAAPAPKQD